MSIGNAEIQALHEEIRACRLCVGQGFPIQPPPLAWGDAPAEFMVIGQAPGITDLRTGRMYMGPAAQKLFGWLKEAGFTDEDFGRRVYMTALTKCFPGRVNGKSTDRAPTGKEVANCRGWLTRQLQIVNPRVVILFGKMAIDQFLGAGAGLGDRIGRRFEASACRLSAGRKDGRVYIPLPHSSGASTWLNQPANRELLQRAIEVIREETHPQASPFPSRYGRGKSC